MFFHIIGSKRLSTFGQAEAGTYLCRIGAMARPALAGLVLAACPAFAQQSPTPPPVPSTLDPNRIRENIEPLPELPRAPPPLSGPASEQQAPEAAAAARFVWRSIRIEGAQALPLDRLMAEWDHAPGAEVSVEDVFRFANAITRLYAREGYLLSFAVVPQQRIEAGDVTIRVVEGFVEAIRFTGDPLPGGPGGPVAALADRITRARPLTNADFERYLLLINDIPGVRVAATVSASPGTPGGSVVTLNISRDKAAAEVGYNSYLPSSLDTHVIGGSLNLYGTVAARDRIRIDGWKSALGDAHWSLGGEYATFIGTDGLAVSLSGFYSNTDPVAPLLELLDYQGKAVNVRLAARYPLIRSRVRNLDVEFAASLANSESDILDVAEMRDRLRTVSLGVSYSFSSGDQSSTAIRLGTEHGLRVLDARGNSRANGVPDYMVLTMEAQRLQPIGRALGGQMSLLMAAQAQYASRGPLLSAAECSLGGRRFGRRFDSGEVTGDHCLLGSMELRWSLPVRLGGDAPGGLQLYGFLDGGTLRQKGALLAGERRQRGAMSAGGGVRIETSRYISGSFEVSRALTAPTGSPLERSVRAMGSVWLRF
ncbi:ShlB/FhaC/HecB family hemolysin secretion/activation protein [Sphingobium sp. SYK-6]|uniref:ShlB/FhaC/HecB family hemolysin secretion/activation protein n=1 Tax=Sphingobium sp. (strain NBRC 103272 / SYK-6) TaxID=627192 RepID=UPI000312709F|nr:POTRA domain-containing protein [Sphingobium sp. SYK-6]